MIENNMNRCRTAIRCILYLVFSGKLNKNIKKSRKCLLSNCLTANIFCIIINTVLGRRRDMQKDHIGNDVRILSHQIHRWIENAPNKKKIDSVTGANAWIIGYISDKTDNNEDVFQKDLESCFEITRSTASKVVNLMVEKGLIERQSVPWDARLKKLVLTDRAREVNKLMIEDFTEVEKILSKGFTEQEMEQFFDYIHRMQKNMKEATAR